MQDLELQINYVIDLAKNLLIEQEGEFYPLCAYINKNQELIPFSIFEGDDNPSSSDLIETFNSIMLPKLKNDEIISFVVAFDCRIKRNENSEKVDAIAINYYHKLKPQSTYFYPYTISNNTVSLQEPWGEIN